MKSRGDQASDTESQRSMDLEGERRCGDVWRREGQLQGQEGGGEASKAALHFTFPPLQTQDGGKSHPQNTKITVVKCNCTQ